MKLGLRWRSKSRHLLLTKAPVILVLGLAAGCSNSTQSAAPAGKPSPVIAGTPINAGMPFYPNGIAGAGQPGGLNPTVISPNGLGAGNTGANPSGCYKTDAFTCQVELAIVALTNQFRAQQGLPALQYNMNIAYVAQDWSMNQAQRGNISHNGFPDARQEVYQQVFGVSPPFISGENVAMDSSVGTSAQAVAQDFVTMWEESPGHRRNMLDSSFTGIGCGFAQSSDGAYATQIFTQQ